MNEKKTINAWCSYDIANSAYNLIITAVLFPVYYQETTRTAFHGDTIRFLNINIKNTVIYDYAIAAAYLLIVFLSPLLSGIADYTGKKKRFMQFFTYVGSLSCAGLYWFNGHNTNFGIPLVAIAVVGYAGSLVFYNSFLPLIATPDHHDAISAKGFSWGYAGSVLLLIFNLITIETYSFWGFANKLDAVRFSFLEVGIWWALISGFAFYFLKDTPTNHPINLKVFTRGFREIAAVTKSLAHMPVAKKFLTAFFLFSMGVQTVMLVATLFGTSVLNISASRMVVTIIVLQLLGIAGATFFGKVSEKKGNKFSLSIMLIIWIAICIGAYFIKYEYQFYILAAGVGTVMGGIQSQSRSTYSKLIPKGTIDTASYFSYYDITEKLAIVMGMFSFGFTEHIFGSMRLSSLVLSVFFISGLVVISVTKFSSEGYATRKAEA
jgi:UMF1 family MFS transporter